jgi:hypothetical protein
MIFSAPLLRGFCFFIAFYGNIKAQKKPLMIFSAPLLRGFLVKH